MDPFHIKVSRIEVANSVGEPDDQISLTFGFERGTVNFNVSITLRSTEFDDTEIVQVARSRLSEIFQQLASQCSTWRLTENELKTLARMNLRPDSSF